MYSPNQSTSNIEDASSSNFPDYILASSEYVPASPRKTYSSSSNNSFGLVPIASPTRSLFHDEPYMKVMHAYYAKESPIPPPVIMPPSLMLSLMFNPQESFLPEELLPLKKHGRDRSSSSTSTLHQELEIGESSCKTSLKHHEEQIKEIHNHLDELSLDRIKNIEGIGKGRVIIQQDFKNPKTELQETRAQVAKLQRKQLVQNNKIALARFRINDLEQIIKEIQARHQVDKETSAASVSDAPAMNQASIRQLVVDSVAATLEAQATNMANAVNTNRNPKPREAPVARKCSYKEFMSYQPFIFKGSEGAIGLIRWVSPQSIEENVTTSKPQTLKEAINIAQRLIDQVTKHTPEQVSSDHKRKFDDKRTFNNNNYHKTTTNNHYNNHHPQQNRRQETFRSYAATLAENSGYTRNRPMCKKCTLHHTGPCTVKCNTCNKKLCEAPILALPEGNKDFVVYCDASHQGMGAELMQRQKRSYANVRRKPLDFQVGDHVTLKVSPRKGVIRFGKQGKLNLRYIGPLKILERIGPVAYKLELLEELSNVHCTFHISNLKKCLFDKSLVIPMKELRLDEKLNLVEEPVEIMDREAMAEEDAFLVDDVEGGLCVDNIDVEIDERCNSGSNKDKDKVGER
nr:putative reverse transcriptase domain-containing protein [Tanacetum cinerariifolium]